MKKRSGVLAMTAESKRTRFVKHARAALSVLLALAMVWWQTPAYAAGGTDADAQAAPAAEQAQPAEAAEGEGAGEAGLPVEEDGAEEAPESGIPAVGDESEADAVAPADLDGAAADPVADVAVGEADDAEQQIDEAADAVENPQPIDEILADVRVGDVAADDDGVMHVRGGEVYRIDLTFETKEDCRFPEDGIVSYGVPNGMKPKTTSFDQARAVVLDDDSETVLAEIDAKFELTANRRLVVRLDAGDADYAALMGAGARVTLRLEGSFSSDVFFDMEEGKEPRIVAVSDGTEGEQDAEGDAPEAGSTEEEPAAAEIDPDTDPDAQVLSDEEAAASLAWADDPTAKTLAKAQLVASVARKMSLAPAAVTEQFKTEGVRVKIEWDDWDDAMGVRPDKATVRIYTNASNPIQFSTDIELKAEDGWTALTDLPLAADGTRTTWYYKVVTDEGEFPEKRYTSSVKSGFSGDTMSAKASLATRNVQATISWDDYKNESGMRPKSIPLTVYADGYLLSDDIYPRGTTRGGGSTTIQGTGWPYQMTTTSSDSSYSISFTLPKYDRDGKEVKYTVEEGSISKRYAVSSEVKSNGTTVITNRLVSAVDFTANVDWENDDTPERLATRPTTVNLTLLANGEPFEGKNASVEISSQQKSYTWKNLPAIDDEGNPVIYSVAEGPLAIYDTHYSETKQGEEDSMQVQTLVNSRRDDWNYAIDLRWDTPNAAERYDRQVVTVSNSTISLKYNLSISTNSRAYKPGEFQVRLPYYLWQKRDKGWLAPTEVSVPKAPEFNDMYAFNYEIDTHGTDDKSDDELVFVNWTDLPAGTNVVLPVVYDVIPSNTYDLQKLNLVATGHAKGDGQAAYEEQVSNALTFRIDTGVKLNSVSKNLEQICYVKPSLSYNWLDPTWDMTKYNYVRYRMVVSGSANQPYEIHMTENIGDEGQLVAWKTVNSNSFKFQFDQDTLTWTPGDIRFSNTSNSTILPTGNSYDRTLDVVVRYPRHADDVEVTPGGEKMYAELYHNTFSATIEAIDDEHEGDEFGPDLNDFDDGSKTVAVTYHDYKFNWNGNIYSYRKNFTNAPKYGITSLLFGNTVPIPNDSVNGSRNTNEIQMEVNGYNFGTWGTDSNKYMVDMRDDNLYWTITNEKGGSNFEDYTKLTADDFRFTTVNMQLTLNDVDRQNGQTVCPPNFSNEPFEVMGLTPEGRWEHVAYIRMNAGSSGYSIYRGGATTDGNNARIEFGEDTNYVGVRLLSPEGMVGRCYLVYDYRIELKPDGPMAQRLKKLEEDPEFDLENLWVLNMASFQLLRNDGNGHYYLANPAKEGAVDAAQALNVYADDIAESGNRYERAYRVVNMGKAQYYDWVHKGLWKNGSFKNGYQNDPVHSKVDAEFIISAAEGFDARGLDESVYKEMSIDEGTFYDLLPAGYTYTEGSAMVHSAPTHFSDMADYYKPDKQSTVTVETFDDYEGSGRQLVVFHVKANLGKGGNIANQMYSVGEYATSYSWGTVRDMAAITGFSVRYKASISWEALTFNRKGNNIVAFYAGEGDTARPFRGKTRPSYGTLPTTDADGYSPSGSYDAPQLKDVNKNGSASNKEVLYAYTPINPNILVPIETGISKQVKALSGKYSEHDVAQLGGNYSYRITFRTSDNGKTGDIVLYDVLEDAANTGGKYGERWWKGELAGVSTKIPSQQGIAPVVYYSTMEGLDYNDINKPEKNLTISNSEVWSTTPPDDLSKVTAVAFDLRKGRDGKAFTFDANSSTSVEIFMKAPKEYPQAKLSYNRPAYHAVYTPTGSIPNPDAVYLNIGTRVTVELGIAEVEKVWADSDDAIGLRPESVAIRLFANDEDTGRTIVLKPESNWLGAFDNLELYDENEDRISYSVKEGTLEGGTLVERDDSDESSVLYDEYTGGEFTEKAPYGYKVSVESVKGANDAFVVTNTLAAAELEFEKRLHGVDSDRASGMEFGFTLRQVEPEFADDGSLASLSEVEGGFEASEKNGAFEGEAAPVSFKVEALEDGDYYYLAAEEDKSGEPGYKDIVFDEACYLAHVKVEDGVVSDPDYTMLYPDGEGGYDDLGAVAEGEAPAWHNNATEVPKLRMRMRFMAFPMAGAETPGAATARAYPEAGKTVNGSAAGLAGGDYAFELREEGADAPVAVATNDAMGRVAFFGESSPNGLAFDAPGTYSYEIREVVPDEPELGVEYDQTVYRYVVEVTRGETGELEAEESYYGPDGELLDTPPVFNNHVEGIDLQVYKRSRYGGEGLDECTYALWMASDAGDVMVQEATSDDTGLIVFKDVALSPGRRYYFKEVEAPAGHTVDPYRTAYFSLTADGRGVELVEDTAEDGWHSKYDNIDIDRESGKVAQRDS